VRADNIELTTSIEGRHWWYRERRWTIARELRRIPRPGRAIEIGAAGGGNCTVLMRHGWDVLATEYLEEGVRIAKERGIPAQQADARDLPMPDGSFDLLIAYDVLEHIEEDHLVAAEIARVLRPGGVALIAVPCDMRLWSAHDVASGHVRRYTRASLTSVLVDAGLAIESLRSWNVLLRPVVRLRRGRATGVTGDAECDVGEVAGWLNATLGAIVRAERYLPVGRLPGVSLMLRARRP
jgi:SAM-dependent methyltransferase